LAYVEATGLATAITPAGASSRIRVDINLALFFNNDAGNSASITVRLKRGTTVVQTWGSVLFTNVTAAPTVVRGRGQVALSYIDSPASASAQTYHVEFALSSALSGNTTTYVNISGDGPSDMILSELTS
jgi:hypothetical protein